jgi:hypothetical protein
MKTKLVKAIIAVLSAVSLNCGSVIAQSDLGSANFAMRGCHNFVSDTAGDSGFIGGWCAGTISAVHYMNQGDSICIPKNVPLVQIGRVVVQYIEQRPARTHEDFRQLVFEARSAWPCQR